ncbi:MAG: hypothetical protein ACE5PT_12315 [Gemmatimonadales bacterium]
MRVIKCQICGLFMLPDQPFVLVRKRGNPDGPVRQVCDICASDRDEHGEPKWEVVMHVDPTRAEAKRRR